MPRTRSTLKSMESPLRRPYRSSPTLMGFEKEDMAHSSRTEHHLWRTRRMKNGRIVTVVYTLSSDRLRLISAQERRRQRREYEKAKKE